MHSPKAVALISGGLDSMLAVKLIQSQGIYVEGINFYTGFCVEGHTHALRKKSQNKSKRNNALWVAEQLNIKLHIIDVIEEYKEVMLNPAHGYGAGLNPCLDCKVFMVKKAHEWMIENHFDFIITGEVIGQRPMSQLKRKMPIVSQLSGANERLLRPLSAKLLPPTWPETQKWVDRNQLCDFSGRSRLGQIELAKRFNFDEYAQPAGGCCFLTHSHYSEKLLDLWESRGVRKYEFDDIMLLKIGHHIRPAPHYKLIIGREESENRFLEGYRKAFIHLRVKHFSSPLTLIDHQAPLTPEDIYQAAQLAAGFSSGKHANSVTVTVHTLDEQEYTLEVKPIAKNTMPIHWYIEKNNKLIKKQPIIKNLIKDEPKSH